MVLISTIRRYIPLPCRVEERERETESMTIVPRKDPINACCGVLLLKYRQAPSIYQEQSSLLNQEPDATNYHAHSIASYLGLSSEAELQRMLEASNNLLHWVF